MTKEFLSEIQRIDNIDFIPWETFRNKTIFITGATGLIGTTLIYALDYENSKRHLGIRIIALARELKKAEARLEHVIIKDYIQIITGDVEHIPEIDSKIDYIVHAASQTASKEIIEHSVETIKTTVVGTINVLNLARQKNAKVVYLSSMEVYGTSKKEYAFKESDVGALDPLNIRNCYPIGKIMAESLCCSYSNEYSVEAAIIRLAQTFGSGLKENDTRIFAYFAKCIKEKQDIILKTRGETSRCYLHSIDAVSAILIILAKGKAGHAYNAADENSYCSIAEIAQRIANKNGLHLKYEVQEESLNGFPQPMYLKIDTSAIKELGWSAENGIDFL